MPGATEVIEVKEGLLPSITFEGEGNPSWKVYGGGYWSLQVEAHREAGWLQIMATESSEKARKRTFITLYPEDAKRLLVFLQDALKEV